MMLESREVELPLAVVWNPRGPYNIETDELGMGFDAVTLRPDLLTAARRASWLLRHEWELRRDSRRIQLHGPDGAW